jgi:uncharacterized protein
MAFEFDPEKSAANARKHGIDFEAAQVLWQDPDALVLASKHKGEPRRLLIGRIGEKVWTAIFTERGPNIRIISVRAARDNERGIYG